VKLTEYAIDDLHDQSTYLLQNDPAALELLNSVYASLLREYIEALTLIRERAR
jgi:hypothetical protein